MFLNKHLLFSWAVGVGGGGLLFLQEIPLAWLLGSMLATSLAAMMGLQITTFVRLTPWARCVLGAMVGTGFEAVTVQEFVGYGSTIIFVPVFLVLATSINYHLLKRLFSLDPRTALFSALPGGMVEMVTSGRDVGADVKMLTTVHLIRVVTIVAGASAIGTLVGVEDLRMQTPTIDNYEYVLLHLALGYVGWKVFAVFRVPSAPLIGPMFFVAALQGFDILHLKLFTPLLILAQVMIGIDIARAFCGVSIGSMRTAVLAGLTSVMAMALVLGGCALFLTALVNDLPWVQIILSFLPGGQTELALLAFAMKLDLPFVVTHQIFRIALIMFALPLLMIWVNRLMKKE